MCVAANAFKLLCMAHLASIERFLYHSNLHFKYQILHACKLASLSWRKSTQIQEDVFLSKMSEIISR